MQRCVAEVVLLIHIFPIGSQGAHHGQVIAGRRVLKLQRVRHAQWDYGGVDAKELQQNYSATPVAAELVCRRL